MIRTLPLLLSAVWIAILSLGCSQQARPPETAAGGVAERPSATSTEASYRVRIDFGDGSRWQFITTGDFETVADLMRNVASHPRAPEIVMTGEGAMAFVSSIGGLDSASGKGWTYYVNGQWADQGIGAEKIAPGDRIDWAYGSWDEQVPPADGASPGE